MAIYMEFDGGSPKGDVTAEGYKDWIKIDSLQWGVGRGISMQVGAISNREASNPSFSEVTISKQMDNASSGLMKASMAGAEGVKVIIDCVRTGNAVQQYCQYTLHDCLVSSYSMTSGGEGAPQESLSISFSKIEYKYTPSDTGGKGETPAIIGYDLSVGKPL